MSVKNTSLIILLVSQTLSLIDPSSYAAKQFSKKTQENQWPEPTTNFYKNQTDTSLLEINKILADREVVCAIHYTSEDLLDYILVQFPTRAAAEELGFIVTHQGPCGACSTLKDLSIYLSHDLTNQARSCGFWSFLTKRRTVKCLEKIGFTRQCALVWYYNIINTKEKCFRVCMKSWFKGEKNNKEDGSLNKCLQCDEDESGPLFKYYSGRTRRNSGIKSEIGRDDEEVYDIKQDYY